MYASQSDELRHWREGLDQALRRPKRKRRPVRFVAVSLVLLIVAGTLGGFLYWTVINKLFDREELNLQPASGGTVNVLMVGSDSREGLTDPKDVERFGSVGGKRADTVILAQLVPREQRGVLLSFPRDLYVPVIHDGVTSQTKINAAYGYGPQSVIDTVAGITRIPINHYMEVNINGFRGMVEAIGGIDIKLEKSLYDSQLNFSMKAGNNHLDGNEALSFVRARHATPGGDFDRIKRQQQFLKAVMEKVGKPSVLGNPRKLNGLARAFAKNVTVDQFFELPDLVKFALSVRRTPSLQTFSVPGYLGRGGGGSVVNIDTSKAEPLFQALRDGKDPVKVVPGLQASGP